MAYDQLTSPEKTDMMRPFNRVKKLSRKLPGQPGFSKDNTRALVMQARVQCSPGNNASAIARRSGTGLYCAMPIWFAQSLTSGGGPSSVATRLPKEGQTGPVKQSTSKHPPQ